MKWKSSWGEGSIASEGRQPLGQVPNGKEIGVRVANGVQGQGRPLYLVQDVKGEPLRK